jgi:hypothetical protein
VIENDSHYPESIETKALNSGQRRSPIGVIRSYYQHQLFGVLRHHSRIGELQTRGRIHKNIVKRLTEPRQQPGHPARMKKAKDIVRVSATREHGETGDGSLFRKHIQRQRIDSVLLAQDVTQTPAVGLIEYLMQAGTAQISIDQQHFAANLRERDSQVADHRGFSFGWLRTGHDKDSRVTAIVSCRKDRGCGRTK